MTTVLLVIRPFGRYATGDLITGAAEIRAAVAGEHQRSVIRVIAPEAAETGRERN